MPDRVRNGPLSLLLVVTVVLASVGVPVRLGQGGASDPAALLPSQAPTASYGFGQHAADAAPPDHAPPHEHHGDPFCARCLAWVATFDVPRAGSFGRSEVRTEPPARAERPWERRVQVRRHGPRGPPASLLVPTSFRT